MNDDANDANVAMVRRRQWAFRVSWYVYGVFLVLFYIGIFAPVVAQSLLKTQGPFEVRLRQFGGGFEHLVFHDRQALPILFVASAFPPIGAYAVRGFFLFLVARDVSSLTTAAWMLALFSPVGMAVKLVLSGMSGNRFPNVIWNDLEYFGMCALPLVMAALLAILAQFVPADEKSSS